MRLISILVTSALVAAAPLLAQGSADFSWSRRLADGTRLTVRNFNGPIEVRASSSDRVEVRGTRTLSQWGRGSANVEDMTVEVNERSGEVEICSVWQGRTVCGSGPHNYNGRVTMRFVVEVPRGVALRLATGNGAIDITSVAGEVNASTGNGKVRIGQTSGAVTVSTGNGEVHVDGARGQVRVNTGNGDVFVTTSTGPVNVQTGNGEIDVRMRTITDAAAMSFSTGSGAVRLTIPADFNGEIDASTGNGGIRTDFDLRIQGRIDPRRLRGTIGTGQGPTIRMRTGNGSLELRKG
jgi:hypothetical protein